MEIKYKKSLKEYDYLVCFDLASKVSGICIWDLKNNIPVQTNIITVCGDIELPVAELYEKLDLFFNKLYHNGIDKNKILICQEAMPIQLRGGSSTVQTLLALSKSHGILNFYTYKHNLAIYDYTGIYPISTHSYLKKLKGWDNTHKVTKDDIKQYVETEYHFSGLTYDEADAVFLAKTFLEIKWNKDLDEKIHQLKKHCKELKSQNAINNIIQEQKHFETLKI